MSRRHPDLSRRPLGRPVHRGRVLLPRGYRLADRESVRGGVLLPRGGADQYWLTDRRRLPRGVLLSRDIQHQRRETRRPGYWLRRGCRVLLPSGRLLLWHGVELHWHWRVRRGLLLPLGLDHESGRWEVHPRILVPCVCFMRQRGVGCGLVRYVAQDLRRGLLLSSGVDGSDGGCVVPRGLLLPSRQHERPRLPVHDVRHVRREHGVHLPRRVLLSFRGQRLPRRRPARVRQPWANTAPRVPPARV